MTPAVSIIMPVYNTEKYLREALDSVLAQTMTDIEVLCVDDGSTDSSLEILREYAAKDPRIIIIESKINNGLAYARNLGLPHAIGKYLLFLDSDDVFNPQMVEKSYARAEETNSDICIFSGELFFEDTGERLPQPGLCRADLFPETVFSAKDHPNEIFLISAPNVWNKLFRREFINAEGIAFPKSRTAEDIPFTFTALACAERITLLNEPLVLYRQRSDSLMRNQDKNPLAFYDTLCELRDRLTARGLYEPLKSSFTTMAAANCLYHLSVRKTVAGFATTYNCIRNNAIPEFGLDNLPKWADKIEPHYQPTVRIPEIQKLSPGSYIALYEPGILKRGFTPETEHDSIWLDMLMESDRIHDEEIQGILNSPSYKIGRAVTAPLRKIRDLLREE